MKGLAIKVNFWDFHMFARALLMKHLKKQDAKLRASTELSVNKTDAQQSLSGKSSIEAEEEEMKLEVFKPLTAEQAQQLRVSFRKQGSVLSPWRIIGWQLLIGLAMAATVGLILGKASMALSVAYGVLAVVVPAALFARGVMSQFSSMNAITAGFGFFVWEALKIAVSIALIALAPRVVADLDWLAMLIGLIVTMKIVWFVLWLSAKKKIAG